MPCASSIVLKLNSLHWWSVLCYGYAISSPKELFCAFFASCFWVCIISAAVICDLQLALVSSRKLFTNLRIQLISELAYVIDLYFCSLSISMNGVCITKAPILWKSWIAQPCHLVIYDSPDNPSRAYFSFRVCTSMMTLVMNGESNTRLKVSLQRDAVTLSVNVTKRQCLYSPYLIMTCMMISSINLTALCITAFYSYYVLSVHS